MTSPDPQIAPASAIVAQACAVARAVQRDVQQVRQMTKDDKSPVTVADFAVQAAVAIGLIERFGQARIVGEEDAGDLRNPQHAALFEAVIRAVAAVRPGIRGPEVLDAIDACNHDASADAYWTLDPIDGTKGFLRGQQYAIALARIEHGEVALGVMGCPNLPLDQRASLDAGDPRGCIYWAARGKGAWECPADDAGAAPRRVAASGHAHGRPLRICESVEASHTRHDHAARVLQQLGDEHTSVRLDSQCKYALVARGQADAYLRLPGAKPYIEKIWDHAAGMLIAQEAGAVVSDIHGSPLDFTHGRLLESNRGVICSVRGLHERIIGAIEHLGIGAAV